MIENTFVKALIFSCFLVSISCRSFNRPLPSPKINIECGRSTNLRTFGLLSPQKVPSQCIYYINARNRNICQLRLDFSQFSLAQPDTKPFVRCNKSFMKVDDITLCGENSRQHIYVPMNPKLGEQHVKITFQNSFKNDEDFYFPAWNITVNQLECDHKAENGNREKEIVEKNGRNLKVSGSEWLAPRGCLQYFLEPTGRIETFNFQRFRGPYLGDFEYNICFRRRQSDSKLKLVPTFFRMDVNQKLVDKVDEKIDGTNRHCKGKDFLYIPHARVEFPRGTKKPDGTDAPGITTDAPNEPPSPPEDWKKFITDAKTKSQVQSLYIFQNDDEDPTDPPEPSKFFCSTSLDLAVVISSPPEPSPYFMIRFNSDKNFKRPKNEIGFQMLYTVM